MRALSVSLICGTLRGRCCLTETIPSAIFSLSTLPALPFSVLGLIHLSKGCPVGLTFNCFTFSTRCCMTCTRVVSIFSVGFETTSSSSSFICFTQVLAPCSPQGLICMNSFPARTAFLRVLVLDSQEGHCSGMRPNILQKVSDISPDWCSAGSSL